jgi:hypothetical protein
VKSERKKDTMSKAIICVVYVCTVAALCLTQGCVTADRVSSEAVYKLAAYEDTYPKTVQTAGVNVRDWLTNSIVLPISLSADAERAFEKGFNYYIWCDTNKQAMMHLNVLAVSCLAIGNPSADHPTFSVRTVFNALEDQTWITAENVASASNGCNFYAANRITTFNYFVPFDGKLTICLVDKDTKARELSNTLRLSAMYYKGVGEIIVRTVKQ